MAQKLFTDETGQLILQAIKELDTVALNKIGDLSSLNTSAKTSLVLAINELLTQRGALSSLTTSDKSSIIKAINELVSTDKTLDSRTGVLRDGLASAAGVSRGGFHNSIFRGCSLGSALTAEQTATIQAAKFDDIWLGDHWDFSNVAYTYKDENGATQSATWSGVMRVAGCDYAWGINGGVTKHHVAVIPDGNLFFANYNAENTTEGGYAASLMHTVHMKRALAIFEACFGADHIVPYYAHYSNAVTNGVVTGSVGDENAKVELMNEVQVYGYQCYKSSNSTTIGPGRMSQQFPLFCVRPDLSGWRQGIFWLKDVAGASDWCCCLNGGPDKRPSVFEFNAPGVPSIGVRPFALVC